MKNIAVIILSAICLYSAANGSDHIRLNKFNDQPGRAVQTIRGHVTDAASGHPLPYVTVTLEEIAQKGTVADPDGNFVLRDVPVGRHTLVVSYVGYEPAVIREVLVTSAKEVV
ncbi:MAG: carboxypeptidase-like regulatory domain-containing protein, partial [Rikenellaceae bacterium]|nr:carboxypeptidase-like regulatory domain-containing protein [Rikenellaceae bacterium]